MIEQKMAPIHPGEVLYEDFMKPLSLSQNRIGRELGVSPRRINEIIHGKRGVTADTALRLGRYFGTTPEYWMNLQVRYDLETAKDSLEGSITKEIRPISSGRAIAAGQTRGSRAVQ